MHAGGEQARKWQFKTFGWQGIRVTVPEQWELVGTAGDYGTGYVRLADEKQTRLELHWEKSKKPVDPSGLINLYVGKLAKKAKKQKLQLSVKRDLNLASLKGRKTECYSWTSDIQSLGMLSYCEECGRLVHMHVMGEVREPLRNLARTVFASLADHPEDGKVPWRFYDVEFETPAQMNLRKKDLKTGCIHMLFSARRKELEFVRFSLARILLSDRSLKEWFEEFYSKTLKKYRYRIRQEQIKGHDGLFLQGSPSVWRNPLELLGRRWVVRTACWYCPKTNRLFVCGCRAASNDEELWREAVESFRCCPTAA